MLWLFEAHKRQVERDLIYCTAFDRQWLACRSFGLCMASQLFSCAAVSAYLRPSLPGIAAGTLLTSV
jgi:hypothetical protein